MKFQTEQLDETTILIKRDENIIAGSIGRVGDHWHVEISVERAVLWQGRNRTMLIDEEAGWSSVNIKASIIRWSDAAIRHPGVVMAEDENTADYIAGNAILFEECLR